MTIRTDGVITTLDGQPVPSAPNAEGKESPLTLGAVCIGALLANLPGSAGQEMLDGQKKYNDVKIADRITQSNGLAELTVEEIARMKELIGKVWGKLIVYRAYQLLEGNGKI